MGAEFNGVAQRARRRIAYRLLPFVFLLYVVNYIDRVNVSFATLGMSADLHFSDKIYGLGVGVFYITYVLFEIPGALIVERWSAKKWIARIMISWGLVTMLTALFAWNGGSKLLSRNDCLLDTLVLPSRPQQGDRVFVCRSPGFFDGRGSNCGLAVRHSLATTVRVALAFHY
jgi:hypothetical protein